ncbi:MAG: pyridoxal-phosphate dependent enzyme [Cyclobacteriaceae bacterium]|nr:pyridoxal-phosphate dependent enzyme [Cyclobacteriaceae bacterium]
MFISCVPGKNDILETYSRIRDKVHKTPVMTSAAINRMSGCKIYFKCENLQKVGAFKARGATNAAFSLKSDQREKGIATHSSGNHAQALAYAAALLEIKAYVIMPRNAPAVKVNAVKSYGGQIIFCDPTLEAREKELSRIVDKTGAYFIHPYNDYDVIAGQATAAYELFSEVPDLDMIITPVGGGGLLSGTSLARNYFSIHTKVFAAEPRGAGDAYLSLQEGRIMPSEKPVTIADGLLTSLGTRTFPIIRDNVEKIILVSDEEIVEAMKLIWERMKIIVEPSASVTLAAVLKEKILFSKSKLGIILSGGNVDINKLPF